MRIREKVSNCIRSKSGETLVETLVAMLIVVMAFTILAGALVSAAKINDRLLNSEAADVDFSAAPDATKDGTVALSFATTGSSSSVNVEYYRYSSATGDGSVNYYYYNIK